MKKDGVTIIFLGDVYLGEKPQLTLAREITDVINSADLVIANQESPISNYEFAVGAKCCLKSALETARTLKSWGIDVVSLANNHMFDFGWEGFEQTRQQLDKAGIRYLGAGENLEQASRPLIVEVKGTRIGLLAYSWGFVQTTCATSDTFGCAPLDTQLMIEQVSKFKSEVDSVIVLPHWGYCGYAIPTPEQVSMARSLIDAGVTAIVGHHSHVVQGIIEQNGTLTAFSLGNFAFADYEYGGQKIKLKKENLSGAILKLVLKLRQVVSHEFIYTRRQGTLIISDNSERRRKEFEKRLTLPAFTDYPEYWRRYVRLRLLKRILYWANIMNWRYVRKDTLIGAFLMFREFFRPRIKK